MIIDNGTVIYVNEAQQEKETFLRRDITILNVYFPELVRTADFPVIGQLSGVLHPFTSLGLKNIELLTQPIYLFLVFDYSILPLDTYG